MTTLGKHFHRGLLVLEEAGLVVSVDLLRRDGVHHHPTCSDGGDPCAVEGVHLGGLDFGACCSSTLERGLEPGLILADWVEGCSWALDRARSAVTGAQLEGVADEHYWQIFENLSGWREFSWRDSALVDSVGVAGGAALVDALESEARAACVLMREVGLEVGTEVVAGMLGVAPEGEPCFVVHPLGRAYSREVEDFLARARLAWSSSVHLDAFVMPRAVAEALSTLTAARVVATAGASCWKVLETADRLYWESTPGSAFNDGEDAIQAAMALEA